MSWCNLLMVWAAALAAGVLCAAEVPVERRAEPEVIEVATVAALQRVFDRAVEDVVVRIAAGEYRLDPRPLTDPTCGNCPDPAQTAETTVGLHVRGRSITLTGPGDRSAVIHTGAGYGIYVDGAQDVVVENLTVTGGARSEDGKATDGAIVVRNSTVTIRNNRITENLGDADIVRKNVSGVMGIVGREGSDMRIIGNEITRNSWDGIALYREARAVIEDNTIDGVDAASGANIGGGRGVGIGVTWDARIEARGNLVKRYWKGIGLFVDAQGVVENNIVEEILTWGISLWDAGGGEPRGVIRGNAVYLTGACGAAITSQRKGDDAGEFTGNALVRTGQDERYDPPDRYCLQCALALHRVPEAFRIEGNMFFENRRANEELPDHDVDEDVFRAQVKGLAGELESYEALRKSSFLREFGGR